MNVVKIATGAVKVVAGLAGTVLAIDKAEELLTDGAKDVAEGAIE